MKTIKLSKDAYAELRKCIEKGDASFDTWGTDLHKEIYKALEGVNLVTIYGLPYVCNQTAEGGMGGQGSYPSCRILTPVERVEIVPESKDEPKVSNVCSQMAMYATVILNEMLALDPKATNTLVETRVPCNKALEEHHSIAVTEDREVGLLGILNGIFGQDGHAFIGARFQKGKLISFNHKPIEEK